MVKNSWCLKLQYAVNICNFEKWKKKVLLWTNCCRISIKETLSITLSWLPGIPSNSLYYLSSTRVPQQQRDQTQEDKPDTTLFQGLNCESNSLFSPRFSFFAASLIQTRIRTESGEAARPNDATLESDTGTTKHNNYLNRRSPSETLIRKLGQILQQIPSLPISCTRVSIIMKLDCKLTDDRNLRAHSAGGTWAYLETGSNKSCCLRTEVHKGDRRDFWFESRKPEICK